MRELESHIVLITGARGGLGSAITKGRRPLAMGLPGKAGKSDGLSGLRRRRDHRGGRTGVRSGNMKHAMAASLLFGGMIGQVLKGRIALPNVDGRIDHFRADVKGRQSRDASEFEPSRLCWNCRRQSTPGLAGPTELRKAPSGLPGPERRNLAPIR